MKRIGMVDLDNLLDLETSETTKLTEPTKRSLAHRQQSARNMARETAISKALGEMSFARGESMDEVRLGLYSTALVEQFTEDADTFAVLRKLQLSPRAEYEFIIPPLGDLIAMIRGVGRERAYQAESKRKANEVLEWKSIWERERREAMEGAT